jgi:hypothetical protein
MKGTRCFKDESWQINGRAKGTPTVMRFGYAAQLLLTFDRVLYVRTRPSVTK